MSLSHYRSQIDVIDQEIVVLVERRMKLSQKIGEIKRLQDLPIEHSEREKSVLESLYKSSLLDKETIKSLYDVIFILSKRCQDE